jgi:hypothetical protein
MSQVDVRIEKYRAIGLGSLPVTAFEIQQTVPQLGEALQSFSLRLLTAEQTVILAFSGLRQLRLADLNPGSLCSLNISTVADAQMEGLRYRASNTQPDLTLDLYCADFEVSPGT